MSIIALRTTASYDVLPELRKILKETWKLKEIRMDYNTRKLPDDWNIDSYPVTIVFTESGEEFEVKILSLTVGYGSEGPTDFARLLDYFSVKYNDEDIFTKKKMDKEGYIRLKYTI